MGAGEQRAKDSKMASDLVARGIYHGKRMSKGLDNIPRLSDVGSAAYRRLLRKQGRTR